MATKTKRGTTVPWTEQDLRIWSIEQAIRWPSGVSVSGAAVPDADIIDRAEKIYAWVTK